MKNKLPPPPQGGRLIKIEGTAAERLQAEMVARVQPHLNELNQENAASQAAITLVFSAAIKHHGVKEVNRNLFDECMQLADKLAQHNLRTSHEKAAELFVEMNVTDIPPHIVRAAKRAGVVLPVPGDEGAVVVPS